MLLCYLGFWLSFELYITRSCTILTGFWHTYPWYTHSYRLLQVFCGCDAWKPVTPGEITWHSPESAFPLLNYSSSVGGKHLLGSAKETCLVSGSEESTEIIAREMDSGGRRGRRSKRNRGLDPENNGIWKNLKKECLLKPESEPVKKIQRRKKNRLYYYEE